MNTKLNNSSSALCIYFEEIIVIASVFGQTVKIMRLQLWTQICALYNQKEEEKKQENKTKH